MSFLFGTYGHKKERSFPVLHFLVQMAFWKWILRADGLLSSSGGSDEGVFCEEARKAVF